MGQLEGFSSLKLVTGKGTGSHITNQTRLVTSQNFQILIHQYVSFPTVLDPGSLRS